MSIDDSRSLAVARIRDGAAVMQQLLESEEYLSAVVAAADAMTKGLRSGNKILFFGNGGSAADAQHLAAELSGRFMRERPSLSGWALTTNSSALTAIGNDYSFEDIFTRQLEGIGSPGDIAFAISTSGNSLNVIKAVEVARRRNLISIALAGKSGGRLRDLVDHCICIPSDHTPRIQEAHILTGHILCELIEEEMFGSK
ncbi:MAG: D-sedoheptulose 7-phosphate isomerase [Candidatus Korobacteraceae bacterium]|jgi:D-sedoheptulose 7-phosphate isomerase